MIDEKLRPFSGRFPIVFAVNVVSTGAGNTPGRITTGQFPAPSVAELAGTVGAPIQGTSTKFNITDALNIFAFRPDLNLATFLKALQTRSLLQILAEPNLITTDGKEANFTVGGPHRLADSDLANTGTDRGKHDIHDAYAANQQYY